MKFRDLQAASSPVVHGRRGRGERCLSVLARAVAAGCALPAVMVANSASSALGQDQRFEYASFGGNFNSTDLSILNWQSPNGHFEMMSTDTHRSDLAATGNTQAEFFNWFENAYESQPSGQKDGNAGADIIDEYVVKESQTTGAKPNWIYLNEISFSQWPTKPEYRAWVIACVARLRDFYHYNVVTYSPFFTNPTTGLNADWQALVSTSGPYKSYIGVESYISGQSVKNNGFNVTTTQNTYQSGINAYANIGIPKSALIMTEHMGTSVSGEFFGSGGISDTDWIQAIIVRQQALRNLNLVGFNAYSWGSVENGATAPTASERNSYEYAYRSQLTLPTEVAQWVGESNASQVFPMTSWNGTNPTLMEGSTVVIDWMGGVPNSAGAVANFYKNLTQNQTITLDGSKTVGTIDFNSNFSFLITPGSGGTLTFNNSGNPASVNIVQGNHSIGTAVQLTSNTNIAVPNSNVLTLGGAVSGTGALTMSGGGTLLITSGASTYSGNTVANGGLIQFSSNNSFGNTNSIVANGGGAVGVLTSSLDPTFLRKINAAASPSTGGLALTSADANTAIDFTSGTLSNPNLVGMSIGALGSVTFNGALTPDPTQGYRLGGGGTLTLPAGTIGGTNNVTIANGGVVVFAGSNSYVGSTQINNSGTLRITTDAALGDPGNSISFDNGTLQLGASINVNNGRALTLNAGGGTIDTNGFATTISQSISGSGDLGKVGAGTLVLSGSNTFTGGVNINGGVLNVNSAAAMGNGGPISFNGGTLQLAGNFALGAGQTVTLGANNGSIDSSIFAATFAGAFGGSGGLTKLGTGTVLIDAGSTYDGTTTISAGTLKAAAANAFSPNSDVTIAASSTLDLGGFAQTIGQLSGAGAITLSGPLTMGIDNVATTYTGKITGTGSLIKTGTGSTLLTVSNVYTGGTIINEGILSISNANSLGTLPTSPAAANLAINNSATLRFNAAMALANTRLITLGAGGGTVDTQTNTDTIAGVISGSGALYKFGTGTLSLSNSNSYSGGTLISGRLNVDANSTDALGSGQISMRGGMGPTSKLIAQLGIGASGVSATLDNAIVLMPGQTPGGNSPTAIGFGGLGTDSFEVATGSTLILNGTISGNGPLYKGIVAGTLGTVVLGGSNSYTGSTLIQTGTLRLSGGNAIPNTSQVDVLTGATFDVNGVTETIGSLTDAGVVLLGSGTLNTGVDGSSTTYAGNISGVGGSLVKQGTGLMQLSGVNTYTGTTAVQGGTLQMGSSTAVPSLSQVNVSSGATFDINNQTASIGSLVGAGRVTLGTSTGSLTLGGDNSTASFSGIISGTGPLTKVGSGTQALANSGNSYTGITTISGGVLAVTAETAIGAAPTSVRANSITLDGGTYRDVSSGAFTIPANRGITVNPAGGTLDFSSTNGVPTLASQITGSGTLTKMGIKTLVVTTNNAGSFNGNWIVRQGRLNAQNAAVNSLGTGSITLAAGNGDAAQLGVGGGPGVTAELANSIVLAPTGNGQNSIEVNTGNTLTLDGAISGSGDLQKSGGSASGAQGGNPLVTAGTLILKGNNSYAGPTTVNDGLLQLSPNGAWEEIPDASDVTLAKTTATLDLNNHNETIGSLSGNGPVTLGSGRLTTGASGASTTHSGIISGGGALTKTGAGLFALGGSNSYTGGTNINAGTLQVSDDSNLGNVSGPINFNGGTLQATGFVSTARNVAVNAGGGTIDNASDLTISGSIAGVGTLAKVSAGTLHVTAFNLGGLNVNNGTVHVLPSGLSPTSTSVLASAPVMTGTGQLDLEDNAMIVNYAASDTTHSVRDQIRNLLVNGRNGAAGQPGAWNGNGGITSTFAHNNGNGFNLAIGYGDNEDIALVRGSGSYTAFGGQTVSSNTVLIQMTRGADATLDGVVDAQDVTILGSHFNKPGSGQWVFGDFDYSGTCDATDVTTLGSTFGKTTPALSPAQMTAEFGSAFTQAFESGQSGAVPEPASLTLIALGGLALMDSRRRKRPAAGAAVL